MNSPYYESLFFICFAHENIRQTSLKNFRTGPKLKFCFVKMAHRATFIYITTLCSSGASEAEQSGFKIHFFPHTRPRTGRTESTRYYMRSNVLGIIDLDDGIISLIRVYFNLMLKFLGWKKYGSKNENFYLLLNVDVPKMFLKAVQDKNSSA